MRVRRTRVWSPKAAPVATVVVVLGLWAAAVPLIGPYFDFGFDTGRAWVFSERHVTLSVVPGLAAALGALLLVRPLRSLGSLGRRLVALAALWLLVGPTLHAIWAGGAVVADAHTQWKRALLWIGYFYGVGGVIVYLAGFEQGLVTRRTRVEETQVAQPQFERVVSEG
jgi:hypothetical protein